MTTKAADDFEAIRKRMESLREEEKPAIEEICYDEPSKALFDLLGNMQATKEKIAAKVLNDMRHDDKDRVVYREPKKVITRWQYTCKDGREVWAQFNPDFPCLYCNGPVCAMSMGGPLVCGGCDCGTFDGRKWTAMEAFGTFYPRAQRRLMELADEGQFGGADGNPWKVVVISPGNLDPLGEEEE